MLFHGVYPYSMTIPEFFCLANGSGRVFREERDLFFKFSGMPVVIRVQKGKKRSTRRTNSSISSLTDTISGILDVAYFRVSRVEILKYLLCLIRRPVVYNEQFEVGKGLCENRVDSILHEFSPIVCGNDDTDERHRRYFNMFRLKFIFIRSGRKGFWGLSRIAGAVVFTFQVFLLCDGILYCVRSPWLHRARYQPF